MAIKPKDVYKGAKKSRRAVKIIVTIGILLVVLMIGLFFGLRQFAVYDENGNATLILPFSQRAKEQQSATEEETPDQDTTETTPSTTAPEPGSTGADASETSVPEPDSTEISPPEIDLPEEDTP